MTVTTEFTDGYWLFKNLFKDISRKEVEAEEDPELGVKFIKLIKQAPKYSVKEFEDLVNSSWNKKINPLISKVIIDLILEKVTKIEKKARHQQLSSEEQDFINDLSILIPNPYVHSPLLGNDMYKISELRRILENINEMINNEDSIDSMDGRPFGMDKLDDEFINTL